MVRLRHVVHVCILVVALAAILTAGCTPTVEEPPAPVTSVEPAALTIGTLATTDSLPLWVAEQRGYFEDEGLNDVEIVVFQSAQERETAFASKAIDASMTDIMMAANLQAGGSPVKLPTIMLGAEPGQGRFAVVAAPGSGIQSITELAGVPVGTASSTITEYVLDGLMAEAGVAEADVVKEEVKKVPVRFELMMAGQLKAAVLPEPFVTLAEMGGATVVAGGDDTQATANLSSSVLAVSADYLATDEGLAAIEALLRAWDSAVTEINSDPDVFRELLVEKARLPENLAGTFKVDSYPMVTPPAEGDIQDVLDWMKKLGYLSGDVKPADMRYTRP